MMTQDAAKSSQQPNPTPVASVSRVMVFIDGANLFNSVKRRFGYMEPNADIARLALAVTNLKPNRKLVETRYYIGVPRQEHDQVKNLWWGRKLSAMGRTGVIVTRRDLRPRELSIELGGMVTHKSKYTKLAEKGIDLRLGLDLVRHTTDQTFDTAVLFTQDNDLSEAIEDAFAIAQTQRRKIVIESAFPTDGGNHRGAKRAVEVPFDRLLYDACIDPGKY